MSDLDDVKLVLSLLVVARNGMLLRGVHDAFLADLMTHSHVPTEEFRHHAGVTHQGAVLGL